MQIRKSKYSDNKSGRDYRYLGDIIVGRLYAVPVMLGSITK